jgi:hypothetical protein
MGLSETGWRTGATFQDGGNSPNVSRLPTTPDAGKLRPANQKVMGTLATAGREYEMDRGTQLWLCARWAFPPTAQVPSSQTDPPAGVGDTTSLQKNLRPLRAATPPACALPFCTSPRRLAARPTPADQLGRARALCPSRLRRSPQGPLLRKRSLLCQRGSAARMVMGVRAQYHATPSATRAGGAMCAGAGPWAGAAPWCNFPGPAESRCSRDSGVMPSQPAELP